MATNDINIGIKVTSNGTTEKETNKVKDLKNMLDQAAIAAGKTSKAMAASRQAPSSAGSRAPTNSQEVMEYGRSRALGTGTGASARDFANQAQGLGGLVRVYATLAANIFAATAAFGALSRAMDTTNMVQGLNQLGAASGTALGSLSKRLVLATDGAVSLREAMEATVKASSAGLNTDQILKLGTVAKNASQALGLNMTDALSRLSRGISKLEPELLDELGIFVKIDDAASKYALSVGKSTAALTDFERRQAFANAVLDQGNKKFGELNLQSNPYSKLAASLADLAQSGLEFVNKFLSPVAKILADNSALLVGAVAFLAAKLVGMAIPALGQWRKGLTDAAESARDKAREINTAFGEAWTDKWETRLKLPELRAAVSKAQVEVAKLGVPQNVSQTVQNYYKTVASGTQLTSGQQGTVTKLIKDNQKAVQDLTGAQDRQSKATRVAREREIAQLQALIRLNTALKAASGPEAKFEKKYESAPSRFMKPFTDPREVVSEKAAQSFSRLDALSRVSANTLDKGVISAVKKLNQELKGSVSNISRYATVAVGAFAGVATSVGLYAQALAGYAAVIGIVIAVGAGLLTWLSNTEKESALTSEGFDRMSGAAKAATETLEKLSNSKDPLAMLSVEGIQARATALGELGDAAAIGVARALDELQKMNNAAGILNWFAGLIGSDVQTKLSKNLTETILKSFQLADENAVTSEARSIIENALGTGIKDAELPDIIEKLVKDGDNKKLKVITDTISDMGNQARISAAKGAELRESMSKVTTTMQEFTKSLKPTDILYKVATDSTEAIYKLDLALRDPITSLNAMVDASKNLDFLSTFPPEVAQSLAGYSQRLTEIRSELQKSNKEVEDYNSRIKALELELNKFYELQSTSGGDYSAQIDKTNELILNLQKAKPIKIVDSLKDEQESIKRIFENSIGPALVQNAERAAVRLNQEFAKLKTVFGSFIADQLGGTKAGIMLRASIERQQIAISNRTLEETNKLSLTMEKLRLTTEESNLLAKQTKLQEQKTKTTTPKEIEQVDKELKALTKRLGQIPASIEQIDRLLAGKKPSVTTASVIAAARVPMAGGVEVPGDFRTAKIGLSTQSLNQDLLRILQGAGELDLQRQQNAAKTLVVNAEELLKLNQSVTKVSQEDLKQQLDRLNANKELLEVLDSENEYKSQTLINEKRAYEFAIKQTSQALERLDAEDRINTLAALLNLTKQQGIGLGKQETANFIQALEAEIERSKLAKTNLQNNQYLENLKIRINNAEKDTEETLKRKFKIEELTLRRSEDNLTLRELELDAESKKLQILEKNDLLSKTALQTSRNANAEKELELQREKELLGVQSQYLKESQDAEKRVRLARSKVEQLSRETGPEAATTQLMATAAAELNEAEEAQKRLNSQINTAKELLQKIFGIRLDTLRLIGDEELIQARAADLYKILKYDTEQLLENHNSRLQLEDLAVQKAEALLRVQEQQNFASNTYLQQKRSELEITNLGLEKQKQQVALVEKFAQRQLDARQRVDVATESLQLSGGLREESSPQGQQLSEALAEQKKVNDEYRAAAALLEKIFGIKSDILEITQEEAKRQAELTKLYKKQEEALERVKNIADVLGGAFGKIGSAFGNFLKNSTESAAKSTEEKKKIDENYAKAVLDIVQKSGKNQKAIDEGIADAKQQRAEKLKNEQYGQYVDELSGLKGFLKQHTAAYKIISFTEKALFVARAAIWLKEMVMEKTKTSTSIAGSAARKAASILEATVDAGKAVIKAIAGLPFPLNIAAGAATAAVVYSIVKKLGGKGDAPAFAANAEQRQQTQGTGQTYDSTGKLVETGGGVFGDVTAKSESIARSLQILKENSVDGLGYDNEIVALLTSIDRGINNTAKSLYSVQGVRTGSMFQTAEGTQSGRGFLGTGLFANKNTTNITDSGLIIQGTFAQLAGQTEGAVMQFYEQVTTTSKKWYGKTKTSIATNFKNISDSFPLLEKQINDIFKDSLTMFAQLGSKLDIGKETVIAKLESLGQLDLTTSLRGLKGEELEKEFNAVISNFLDRGAAAVFGAYSQFQKFGEGLLETVVRIDDQTTKANQQLKNIGMSDILDQVPERIIGDFVIDNLVQLSDGLESFLEKTNYFRENFFTTSELLEPKINALNNTLEQFGLSATSTRDDFKRVVQSLDLLTVEGQQAFTVLLNSAEDFYKVTEKLTELRKESKSLELEFLKLTDTAEAYKQALRSSLIQGLTEAEVAVFDYNEVLKEQITSLTKTKELVATNVNLELELLKAQGDLIRYNALMREKEIEGLNEAQIGIYDYNQGLKEQIAELEKTKSLRSTTRGLQLELLKAQGNMEAYTNALKRIETEGLDPAQIAIYDYNTALRDQIDVLSKTKELTDNTRNLQAELLRATGNIQGYTAAIRSIEIEGLTPAQIAIYDFNKSLEEQIKSYQELAEVSQQINTLELEASTRRLDKDSQKALTRRLKEAEILKLSDKVYADILINKQKYLWLLEDRAEIEQNLISARDRERSAIEQTIESIEGAITSLKEYKKNLLQSSVSPLTAGQKYSEKRSRVLELQQILTKTPTTEAERKTQIAAASELPGVADSFLELSRTLYASSTKFTTDFDLITSILDTSVDTTLPEQVNYEQQQLSELENSTKFLKSIDENIESVSTLLARLTGLDALLIGKGSGDPGTMLPLLDKLTGMFSASDSKPLSFADLKLALHGMATDAELQNIIETLDSNSDNAIDTYEFNTGVLGLYLSKNLTTGFDLLDTNLDGKLSSEEFAEGLKGKASDETIQFLMDLIDTNNDGLIDELERNIKLLDSTLNQAFAKVDEDLNGQLTLEEFQKITGLTNTRLQDLIKEIDINKDGVVNSIELMKLLTDQTLKAGFKDVYDAIFNSSEKATTYVTNTLTLLKNSLSSIDTNLDSQLTLAEFQKATGLSDTRLQTLITKIDLNKDGVVDSVELLQLVLNQSLKSGFKDVYDALFGVSGKIVSSLDTNIAAIKSGLMNIDTNLDGQLTLLEFQKATGLSDTRLQALIKQVDLNKDDLVDSVELLQAILNGSLKTGFKDVYDALFGTNGKIISNLDNTLAVLKFGFANIDTDLSGAVTLTEFQKATGLSDTRLQALIKQVDLNEDGVVDAVELLKSVTSGDLKTGFKDVYDLLFGTNGKIVSSLDTTYALLKLGLSNIDADLNGQLTLSEFQKATGLSDTRLQALIKQVDLNEDGVVDSVELLQSILNGSLKTGFKDVYDSIFTIRSGIDVAGSLLKTGFANIDTDLNGAVTLAEFQKATGLSDTRLQALIKQVDLNEDGVVDSVELLQSVTNGSLKTGFKDVYDALFGTNGKVISSLDATKNAVEISSILLKTGFANIDADLNGAVTLAEFQKATGLSDTRLQTLITKIDLNKDGVVDSVELLQSVTNGSLKTGFKDVYDALFGTNGKVVSSLDNTFGILKSGFANIDADLNGQLTLAEFKSATGLSDTRLQAIIKQIDLNEDGVVDSLELLNLATSGALKSGFKEVYDAVILSKVAVDGTASLLKTGFANIDADLNGAVTLAEFQKATGLSDARLQALIKQVDLNEDGVVDSVELLQSVTNGSLKTGFKDVYDALFGTSGKIVSGLDSTITQLKSGFANIDTDLNGQLTLSEFQKATGLSDTRLQALIKQVDLNEDGVVDSVEALQLLTNQNLKTGFKDVYDIIFTSKTAIDGTASLLKTGFANIDADLNGAVTLAEFQKATGLSDTRLQALIKQVDLNEDGVVDSVELLQSVTNGSLKTGFKDVYDALFGTSGKIVSGLDSTINQLKSGFASIDADLNGQLTLSEFQKATGLSDTRLQALIKQVDLNEDGVVDSVEALQLLTNQNLKIGFKDVYDAVFTSKAAIDGTASLLKAGFANIDADLNGAVTLAEFQKATGLSDTRLQALIKQVDLNEDGVVDSVELLQSVTNNSLKSGFKDVYDALFGTSGKIVASLDSAKESFRNNLEIAHTLLRTGFANIDTDLNDDVTLSEFQKATGLSDTRLKELIKQVDVDGDGVVRSVELAQSLNNGTLKTGFREVYDALFGTNGRVLAAFDVQKYNLETVTAVLRGGFSNIDTDLNGAITSAEFQRATGLTDGRFQTLIKQVDIDGDSVVRAVELAQSLNNGTLKTGFKDVYDALFGTNGTVVKKFDDAYALMRTSFLNIDQDLNGQVTLAEFRNASTLEQTKLDALIRRIDVNGDGVIDAVEWLQYWSRKDLGDVDAEIGALGVLVRNEDDQSQLKLDSIISTAVKSFEGLATNIAQVALQTNQVANKIVETNNQSGYATAYNTSLIASYTGQASDYLYQIATTNAKMANTGGATGSSKGGGSSAAKVAGAVGVGVLLYALFSDQRLKKNIELNKTLANGINLYDYEYKDSKYGVGKKTGVIAQEVMGEYPEAVTKDNSGYYMVDYSRLPISPNLLKFANGGVFSSGIVKKPVMFNTGLMGEAGPEAILPLSQTSDGKLGVTSTMPRDFNGEYLEPQINNQTTELVIELKQIQRELQYTRKELEELRREQNKQTGSIIVGNAAASKELQQKIQEAIVESRLTADWNNRITPSVRNYGKVSA